MPAPRAAGSRAAALRAFPAPCASRLARASPPPTQLYNGLSGKRLTSLKPFPMESLRGACRFSIRVGPRPADRFRLARVRGRPDAAAGWCNHLPVKALYWGLVKGTTESLP